MSSGTTLTIRLGDQTRTVTVDERRLHLDLTAVLRQAGVSLNTRCGQRGLCDGCLVDLLSGPLIDARTGTALPESDKPHTVRACQYRMPPQAAVEIHVPARSLLAHEPQVVTSFRMNVSRAHDPLWQRNDLPGDTRVDGTSVAAAVCAAVSRQRDYDLPLSASPELERADKRLPESGVVLEQVSDAWLVRPAEQADLSPALGIAVDVGTTTVVAILVDLQTEEILNTASAMNAQVRLGDNVLTRIQLCITHPKMIGRLQHAIVARTLSPLIEQLLRESGATAEQVRSLVVAGNTTMLHLFAGVDPSSMGTAPFTPRFLEHRVLRTNELPLRLAAARAPAVHLLPSAAAYVGADVIAGVFSSGMAYRDDTSLLVDVGTNGEIVLKHGDRFWGCATAAGPAFEGSGLSCGMRAGRGAISHIRLAPDSSAPAFDVIGDAPPIGVCGTAYVDFVAQARRTGILRHNGRFAPQADQHDRVRPGPHGREFLIADGADGKPVYVSESDVARLLQAKAAIAAGILCLLERVGLTPPEVKTLYLAGGFGFHMDIENVIRCGLLPGFRPEQISLVGNTSLAGAYLALLDSSVLDEIKRISGELETVELNLIPSFESCYIDQLAVSD